MSGQPPTGGGPGQGDGGIVNIPLPGMPSTGMGGADLPTMDSHPQSFRDAVYRFLTGDKSASTGQGASLSSQLSAAFGSSARNPDRPDTAAAAKGLGVSRRTVQRWVREGRGISTKHQKTLQQRARQAASTKRGRERALRRADKSGTNQRRGNGISVGGHQGVVSDIDSNYRDRGTHAIVTDEDFQGLRQAWVNHGDSGVDAWLHHHFDAHYEPGWHFRDVDDIDWTDSHNY